MNLFWNRKTRSTVLYFMRFLPVRRKRIICICWGGAKYNCNPKAITDALLRDFGSNDFKIVYVFKEPEQFRKDLPGTIEAVQIGTFRYFYLLSTSRFIIANTRLYGLFWPFPKKSGQLYIQTQHGGHGIKKVELDVRNSLTEEYISNAIEDTSRTDLMISDSQYWTNVYRTAYQYKGEVIEKGLPRNDVFFANPEVKNDIKNKLLLYIKEQKSSYRFDERTKLLIYTPTFRNNGRRDVYGFDVDKVISALEERFSGIWYILVSSHPNMLDYYKEVYDFSHPRLIDVGLYPELQDILVVSDALVTDYSSAEMDFSLTGRPIFQLIRDAADYDRGTYLEPTSLPFPYADNDDALCMNILHFDNEEYQKKLAEFNDNVIGLHETGRSVSYILEWILSRQ